jgi:2-phospho-L-lactate/phosphoenolpyruvate guanylyltransferase
MKPLWVVLPVKPADSGKSRLATVLSAEERAALMRSMAADVLRALGDCPELTGVAILGNGEPAASLAQATGCLLLADDASGDLCTNLDRAAATLAAEGVNTLLILPADLPGVTSADIGKLLAAHQGGVTIAVAERDGGTNALLLTPPGAIGCLFGPDSAARHIAAARAQGLPCTALHLPAFARDIDTVDDVRWFCSQAGDGATHDYLQRSGICERLRYPDETMAP